MPKLTHRRRLWFMLLKYLRFIVFVGYGRCEAILLRWSIHKFRFQKGTWVFGVGLGLRCQLGYGTDEGQSSSSCSIFTKTFFSK